MFRLGSLGRIWMYLVGYVTSCSGSFKSVAASGQSKMTETLLLRGSGNCSVKRFDFGLVCAVSPGDWWVVPGPFELEGGGQGGTKNARNATSWLVFIECSMVTLVPHFAVIWVFGSQAVSHQWEHARNTVELGWWFFSQRTGLGLQLAVMRIGAPQTLPSVSNEKLLQFRLLKLTIINSWDVKLSPLTHWPMCISRWQSWCTSWFSVRLLAG